MSNNYPFNLLEAYRKQTKTFEIDEKFISTFLIYIIDYFHTKGINILNAVNIDKIFISEPSEAKSLFENETFYISDSNNDLFDSHAMNKYLSSINPIDLVEHILRNIIKKDDMDNFDFNSYRYIFRRLHKFNLLDYFHKEINPKLIANLSILEDKYKQRIFAGILADMFMSGRIYNYYDNNMYSILEKYKLDPIEIPKHMHHNPGLHHTIHEYVIDIYENKLQHIPITDYIHPLETYLQTYIENTNIIDVDLCAHLLNDKIEIRDNLSISDKFIIYGYRISDDVPVIYPVRYLLQKLNQ